MKAPKYFALQKQKQPLSLILELDYNRNLEDFSNTMEELKKMKINEKKESVKNEDDEMNILYYEDSELKELMNKKEFPDKDFNIVNNFLRVEEEENLIRKETQKNKNKYINYEYGSDDDGIVLNQLNHKLLLDEEFQPGLFTSFDFKDKIKSLIFNSLTSNNSNFDFTDINKNLNKGNKSDSSSQEENIEVKKVNEDKDGLILDMCLKDKNIESDNIVINFNEEVKEEENKINSILEEDRTDYEGISKSEAIPEYENQILSFQNYYQIEDGERYSNHPKVEKDVFDRNLFNYLASVSKIIQDKGLKNKIKLVMKLILYKDDKSKKSIFNNKEKNELFLYWKNRYIKELEDATYKEKNKILKKKLESLDPNNKIIELTKKKKNQIRKAIIRKSAIDVMGNFKQNNNMNSGYKKPINKGNQNPSNKKNN